MDGKGRAGAVKMLETHCRILLQSGFGEGKVATKQDHALRQELRSLGDRVEMVFND